MATPEKKKGAPNERLTPGKISLGQTPPRSPLFPEVIIDYTEPLTVRYAAGILPLSYVMDESTNTLKWKILLLIEFRSKEKRNCLHPLAGKKEDVDDHYPIRTAFREFTEETYGVYASFDVLGQISTNTREHSLVHLAKESKMIFFYTYIPYKEDIQEVYKAAKGSSEQGEALIWYDLDEYLALHGRIFYKYKGEKVIGSDCAQQWFAHPGMLAGFERMRDVTLERIKKTNSPVAPSLSDTSASSVSDLTASLESTHITTAKPLLANQATSSSAPTSETPKETGKSDSS